MMNDYSQSGQDEWVLSIIKHKGYFADFGAFDGRQYSNTLRLEEAGWKGLCVEPNPKNYELLAQNRNCLRVRAAIATHVGFIKMNDEGSSSKKTEDGKIKVLCETFSSLFYKFNVPKYIDYISSDMERMDAEVWETFPFDEYSFGLATIEHCLYEGNNNFKERIKKVMFNNGYILAKENVEHENSVYEDWFANPKFKNIL